jgi:hypothetical protein
MPSTYHIFSPLFNLFSGRVFVRAKELENRMELGYKGGKVSSDKSGFTVCGTGMPNEQRWSDICRQASGEGLRFRPGDTVRRRKRIKKAGARLGFRVTS